MISSELAEDTAWLGAHGERVAVWFLRKQGYKILYRNFRAKGGGEVDIVCRHGETLVFVEVKTRTSEDYGRPFTAVNNKKRNLIRRGALQWLRWMEDPEVPRRFDVVEIVIKAGRPEVTLLENAFQTNLRP